MTKKLRVNDLITDKHLSGLRLYYYLVVGAVIIMMMITSASLRLTRGGLLGPSLADNLK